MNIPIVRWIDRIVGGALCIVIGLLSLPFPKAKLDPKRILIIKLWAFGDSVVLLPAIRELRRKYPRATIDILCKKPIRPVFEGIKDIDTIRSGDFFGLLQLLRYARSYDAAVDCEPYLRLSALLGWWLAKRRLGFSHGVRALLYTDRVKFNDEQHMVKTYVDLLGPVGVTKVPDKLVPLAVTAADKKRADAFMKEHGVKPSDKLIALCPSAGASSRSRIWMPERFAAAADGLVKEYLAKIILVSAKSEKGFVDDVAGRMKHASIPGYELNLKQQAAVYSRCALVITNDSGPMHVAAAMGAQTLGLFCPNTPVRWAPYGPGNDYLYKPVREKPCINTHKEQFPECKGHGHLTNITVEDVLQKARRMLHARRN